MESHGQYSIWAAQTASYLSLAANVLGYGDLSTVSTCSATFTATSIHELPTELISQIVDKVDSSDLHNLNLTCKAFHTAIQSQRWRHVRLVGLPQHISRMIRNLIELAENPESLVSLRKITIASIIVLPGPHIQEGRTDWLFAADLKYSRSNTPDLVLKLNQVIDFLGNKENCPQLGHLTFDGSGLDGEQAYELNRLGYNPIDGISLRLIGTCDGDPIYDMVERCVSPVDVHVSHRPAYWFIDYGIIRRLHYVVAGGSMEVDFVDSGGDVLLMEWLSIDGYDRIFDDYHPQLPLMRERAQRLSYNFQLLQRLALTWRDTGELYLSSDPSDVDTLDVARIYFEENPCMELVTFRLRFPRLVEIEKVGHELKQTKRNMVEEPREDGWPNICP